MISRFRERGVTLIELIMVIVVVSIALVALAPFFGGAATSLAVNEQVQTASQYAQACAEHIVQFRRDTNAARGFANVTVGSGISICNTLPLDAAYVRTVDVTDVSASSPPCPVTTANTCKQAVVTVTAAGTTRAQITLLLVN